MMNARLRFCRLLTGVAAAAAATGGTWAAGPIAAQTESTEARVAVVTGDDVYVRSGHADSYYPCGKVHRDDLVLVIGEKFGWSKVQMKGPAFRGFFGYVKYPKGETNRLRVSPDGRSAVTLGSIDVLAPNLDTKFKPKDSWVPVRRRLPTGTTLAVLETTELEREVAHKVALPDDSEAWISARLLRVATAEEAARFEASLVAPVTDSVPGLPGVPGFPGVPGAVPGSSDRSTADEARQLPLARAATVQEQREPPAAEPVRAAGADGRMAPRASTAQDTASPQPPVTAPPAQEEPPPAAVIHMSDPDAEAKPMDGTGDAPGAAPEPAPPPRAQATLEDLEAAYKKLLNEPLELAEVGPLRSLYMDLAARRADDAKIVRYANARARQLEIWSQGQQRLAQLAQIKARARLAAEDADAARLAMDRAADYTAVGRLTSSSIYDGTRLPRLLRLLDPATGRTIAYLEPSERFSLLTMLDQLIGVVGEKSYDGGLRLNVIRPRRIDILAPQAGAPTSHASAGR
jgi:hypothetical protein